MINFDNGTHSEKIFARHGVFIYGVGSDKPTPQVVFGVERRIGSSNSVLVAPEFIDGYSHMLTVDDDLITINEKTGTIEFKSGGVGCRVRELREEDGYWMSTQKIALSVPILEGLADSRRNESMTPSTLTEEASEKLIAYAYDDSLYIVGLVYSNSMGRWARIGGDWVLLAGDDRTYNGTTPIIIDPDKADEYITLYDRNYIPVADTEEFELKPAAEEAEPEPATEK